VNGKLKVLDLFSGIGGFSLGLERTGGFETVAFCEIEDFPRKVLKKHWPDVPCFEDVRKLKGSDVGAVDVICGGYPCQPFSTAGKRRGKKDDRHLWPEFSRLVAELRPSWVIGENVAGHISMGLDDVLSDLEGQGYTCRSFIIPACALDAPHRRDRVWTVAHANDFLHAGELDAGTDCGASSRGEVRDKQKGQASHGKRVWTELGPGGKNVANPDCERPQGGAKTGSPREVRARRDEQPKRRSNYSGSTWLPEPNVGRVAHGVPARVDRLKSLGNAVVPQIPEIIGRAILESES